MDEKRFADYASDISDLHYYYVHFLGLLFRSRSLVSYPLQSIGLIAGVIIFEV